MNKRVKQIIDVTFAVMVAGLTTLACEDSTVESNDDTDTNDGEIWLERQEVPNSPFAPLAHEEAINNIVAALNETPPDDSLKFSFIPKDLKGYFEPIIDGAKDAFAELGVIHIVEAPSAEDEAAQTAALIDLLNQPSEGGYDGIGVAPAKNTAEITAAIDGAVDTGTTVITFDSDAPDSKRQLYVGTINSEAGKTAGNSLLELLGDNIGTVVIFGWDNTDWLDGYDRTHEARKVLEAAGHTVVIQHVDWEDEDTSEAGMKELLENADPPAVGCLGVFGNAWRCGTAAETAGVLDSIKIAAFDLNPTTLEMMEDGKIQVTHAQRQYYMGYLVVYVMYAAEVLGLDAVKELVSDIMVDDNRIDMGLDVIPANKIEEYTAFVDNLGI